MTTPTEQEKDWEKESRPTKHVQVRYFKCIKHGTLFTVTLNLEDGSMICHEGIGPDCLSHPDKEITKLPTTTNMEGAISLNQTATSQPSQQNWEEQFDNTWSSIAGTGMAKDIKQFIRSLLSTERQKHQEEMEKVKQELGKELYIDLQKELAMMDTLPMRHAIQSLQAFVLKRFAVKGDPLSHPSTTKDQTK